MIYITQITQQKKLLQFQNIFNFSASFPYQLDLITAVWKYMVSFKKSKASKVITFLLVIRCEVRVVSGWPPVFLVLNSRYIIDNQWRKKIPGPVQSYKNFGKHGPFSLIKDVFVKLNIADVWISLGNYHTSPCW